LNDDEELVKMMKQYYYPQFSTVLLEPRVKDFIKLSIGKCNKNKNEGLQQCSKCLLRKYEGLISHNISLHDKPVDLKKIYENELKNWI
jgi:hypothetical protein